MNVRNALPAVPASFGACPNGKILEIRPVPMNRYKYGSWPYTVLCTGIWVGMNMFYVYLLMSRVNGRIYTGYTADLKRRIHEHMRGEVHTTKRMHEPNLVYYEAFTNKEYAQERERYLKTTKGKRTVRLMLKNTFAPFV